MTAAARHAYLRVALAIVGSIVGFVLIQGPFRVMESETVAALLVFLGAGATHVPYGAVIEIFPSKGPSLLALVSVSCSSLSSLLAIACLSLLGPGRRSTRWWLAVSAALATVAVGNILRIAASLGVGLLAGRPALVLFHDWVGGVLAFGYTLGGYILFLYLMLPRGGVHERPVLWRRRLIS